MKFSNIRQIGDFFASIWRRFSRYDSTMLFRTVWKLRKFTITPFWQIFVKTTLSFLLNSWFDEIFGSFFNIFAPQCGNYRNSLSHFFRKNFVKAVVLLKKLLNSWFDEIFLQWERISCFSTLTEKNSWNQFFALLLVTSSFSRNFREKCDNQFPHYLAISLWSRNF